MLFGEALHDADGADGVFDLPQSAFELFDVLLHVAEVVICEITDHPRVVYDVLCLYAPLLFDRQQLTHQVPCRRTHIAPIIGVKFYSLRQDFLLEFHLVFRLKRRISAEEDVENDAYGPPVDLFIVLEARKDFWCHVKRCADCRGHEMSIIGNDLGNAEVY